MAMLTPEQELPVYAVISNQNTGNTLLPLLSSIYQTEERQQPYDGIVVVDGGSNDNSQQIVESYQEYDANLDWLGASKSAGSSSLKNRGALHVHEKAGQAILHFIEADMELVNGVTAPSVANNLLAQPNVAFVGGLIQDPNGRQHILNYGPRYCLATYAGAAFLQLAGNSAEEDKRGLPGFPNPHEAPTARKVGWVMERNMLITTTILEALGGFDNAFKHRHHDAQPLALAAMRQHLDVQFDPSFPLTQLPTTSDRLRPPRIHQMLRADARLIRRYVGFRHFIKPKR